MYEYKLYEDIIIGKNYCVSYIKDKNSEIKQFNNTFFIKHQDYIKPIQLIISNLDNENNIVIKNFVFEKYYDYKIEYNITSDEGIESPLFITTYKEEKKLFKEYILPNKKHNITKIESGEYSKLSIRILGEGSIIINSIKIYRRKSIDNIQYEDYVRYRYSKVDNLNKLKIACIFDSFTMSCYKDMCELIPVDINTFKFDLRYNRPHILIVESAWKGNDEQWSKMIQYINEYNTQKLKELIMWCKENCIPTVFWNKEDPVHFNHFIHAAKLFDYVFTTDEKTIYKYKDELNHKNIYSLPFAAQPSIHNPIKITDKRIEKACFAGSFNNFKYPERKDNLEMLLKLAKSEYDLDIYDRNFNSQLIQYKFPEEFRDNIRGYLSVDELYKVNKTYKIMLNINTVKDSPTMFSRRVFEVLACGTPVISTYSIGINNLFNGVVVSTDDQIELKKELKCLCNNYYYENKKIKGIREVLSNHTYYNRLKYILEKVDIKINDIKTYIAMVGTANNLQEVDSLKNIYENQEYKYKRLYLIVKNQDLYNLVISKYKDIRLIFIDDKNLNENTIFEEEYISIIKLNNYYGRYYLIDLYNATLYTNAEIIGKKSYIYNENDNNIKVINKDNEFEYVNQLLLDRSIVKNEIINLSTKKKLLEIINLNEIDKFKFGIQYFSIDKYNFIENYSSINTMTINKIEI